MAFDPNKSRFVAAYGTAEQLPEPTLPEVSFVGRSNVGKSSLINKLLARKQLAKVSSTPGKTATINFYEVDGIHLVDLPGYGFAQRSKAERQRWADLITGYFEQDRSFNLVVSLVDIRHDAQKLDMEMLSYLAGQQLPFMVALTKADKIPRSKQKNQLNHLAKQFGLDPMAFIITSSETGQGIDQLKAAILRQC